MVAVEDGDLRRDLYLGQFDQGVFWIAQGRQVVSIFAEIVVDSLRGLGLVWKDEPEAGVRFMLRADLLNDGGVAAGDWAVPAKKNQHDNLARSRIEWIRGLAVEIEGAVLTERQSGSQEANQGCCQQNAIRPECREAAMHKISAPSKPIKILGLRDAAVYMVAA